MKRTPVFLKFQAPFLVTVITLMIWLLAEAQTLRTETIRIVIRFDAGSGSLAVRPDLEMRPIGEVEIEVEAPAAGIARLRELGRTPVVLTLGDELPDEVGTYEVGLIDAISADELFRGTGRRIRSVRPDVVTIEVDSVVELEVGVLVDPGAVAPSGTPLAEPPTVTVRAPASVADLIPDRALARLPGEDAERLEPGITATSPAVPVTLPDLPTEVWGMSMEPTSVAVTITPRRRTLSVVLDSTPVLVLGPPELMAAYRVELDEGSRTTRVRITGPVAAVERIRGGDRTIAAVLRLTEADLGRTRVSRAVEIIDLPTGVSAEAAGEPVVVRLTPIAAESESIEGSPDSGSDSGSETGSELGSGEDSGGIEPGLSGPDEPGEPGEPGERGPESVPLSAPLSAPGDV